MKIGILTFHYSCNYGGVLQAYALQKTLTELGYDVEIVNYIPSSYHKTIREFIPYPPKRGLDIVLQKLFHYKEIKKSFDLFRELNLNLSFQIDENSLSKLNGIYDILIVGSDQVWNTSEQQKCTYFLNWEPKFQGKRIAYAVCSGSNVIIETRRTVLKDALKDFNAISVRNQHTCEFVESLIGISPVIVADPVILHPFYEFISPIKERYILVYVLGKEIVGSNEVAIKALKKIFHCNKVIAIVTVWDNPQIIYYADVVLYDLLPNEWVNLIANAACVYTDSFHGSLFALKFNTPFVAYYSEAYRKDRFVDLILRYGIQNNIITEAHELENKSMSYFKVPESVKEIFIRQRIESIRFLDNNIAVK